MFILRSFLLTKFKSCLAAWKSEGKQMKNRPMNLIYTVCVCCLTKWTNPSSCVVFNVSSSQKNFEVRDDDICFLFLFWLKLTGKIKTCSCSFVKRNMQSFFLWVIISGFSCFCQFFFPLYMDAKLFFSSCKIYRDEVENVWWIYLGFKFFF